MKLYLMRHGQASNMADSDHARPLTQKGEERTKSTAKVLAKLEITPTAIYASPRVRAQQTAAIIAEALNMTVTTQESLNFDFDLKALEKILGEQEDPDHDLILVGHNPSMSDVLQQLTGVNTNMKTGAIACIEVDLEILRASMLHWLVTPKIFGAIIEDDLD
ncbi:phosphohistidine phosphatase SixA [Phototrophicus methaneseepsis]|uniref:Phosphohistidine phosphatase SixA n=1 Tax=Phototrophicus methaneseepsis TaxID=2710758 RepID=A0A7S8EC73_9CHLR|nr:phosphohistidine phosphatase SixA [Phototrophicus methaneseepsis]QPC84291.1 phosphohistidine phosphatase SixA [Phototrophicus methaneseepsis]